MSFSVLSPYLYKPFKLSALQNKKQVYKALGVKQQHLQFANLPKKKQNERVRIRFTNMEQKKINHENNNNKAAIRDEDGYKGVPIHSQVMKIKREFEKIKHPSLQQADMRRVLREITRQRSRSPLGLAERPIAVGHS
ncbi:uncharacterized protein [Gossypium hirsutum]|uniref:Uncharacterized protein n=12 Tax=Gossypium TaxID=3633 RepID=A0A1U8KVZ8_GOSHI|nr:uncharacterized protein LOC107921223 [Gossypium hirsutum]